MPDEAERRVLICHRVADFREGPPALSRVDTCARCEAAVWVAYSSPPVDEQICMQCAAKEIDHTSKFEPITPEQLADVQEHLTFKQRARLRRFLK